MPRGNRSKRPAVIIETDGIVKTGGFGRVFAKTHYPFGTIVGRPRRAQPQTRIVSRNGDKLAAVSREQRTIGLDCEGFVFCKPAGLSVTMRAYNRRGTYAGVKPPCNGAGVRIGGQKSVFVKERDRLPQIRFGDQNIRE